VKKQYIGLLVAGLGALAVSGAHAIVIRHDLADSDYIVADSDYPALVTLFEPDDCTGTLVHESYLLTVAHCAADLEEGQFLVVNGVRHAVAEVIRHPRWRSNRDNFDIALVRFQRPVRGVTPLPIYRGAEELGAVVTLVGRGVHATGLQGERRAQSDGNLRGRGPCPPPRNGPRACHDESPSYAWKAQQATDGKNMRAHHGIPQVTLIFPGGPSFQFHP